MPVYLAGRGLCSALGATLPEAIDTLKRGLVAPGGIDVSPGVRTPYFGMPPSDEVWATRARRLVVAAVQESGALGRGEPSMVGDSGDAGHLRRTGGRERGPTDARDGALLLASTSFDMGVREHGDAFELDIAAFAETVGGWLGWRGPVFVVCTACTSAVNALMSAAALLRAGDVDDALVLGFELANRFTVGGFHSMQLLASGPPQPLGANASGLVLGEAVAALHLSSRPARWRVCGGANVVDSSDPAGAAPGAVASMTRQALATSGLKAEQIDLVKLQAAGSPTNDATELAGLRQVFGELPPVLSSKAWLGHTLGAAGAAELALLTACIEADAWPAPGYRLDPELRAPWASQAPARLRHVLAIILGFGGGHAAVVLEDTSVADPA
ncbi:MAG: hypothetical protein AD742_10285 [Methylibium sp. NZG]|nr:MAG: hypothetical protein AD742_10285 [Methylibium sp. NZG]